MFELLCKICNQPFQAKTMFTSCCSSKCRQRKYRLTDKGKQQYLKYNQRYKIAEIELVCQICNQPFMSAIKNRSTCNQIKCKSKAAYLAQKKQRLKCPEKRKANDIINKRIQRNVSLSRQPCSICCSPQTEAHHNDYNKPLEVTWLCKEHHERLHVLLNRFNSHYNIKSSNTINISLIHKESNSVIESQSQ